MVGVMQVDTAPRWWFLLIAVLASAFLLAALILGATGPDMLDSRHSYAYSCPGQAHVWNASTCTGILMRDGVTWAHTFGDFKLLNKLWLLDVTPYKWDANASQTWQDKDLEFNVSIFGSDDENMDPSRWKTIIANDTHRMDFTCDDRTRRDCDLFTLVDMQYIDYAWYRVELHLAPSSARELVGDMKFSLYTYNLSFSTMELGLRLAYLFVALLAMMVFVVKMRGTKFAEWTFEQKSAFFLVLGLLLYNDILFPFEFWLRGWFFEFTNSVFEVLFIAGLMLFWLIVIDKIGKDELTFAWNYWRLGKAVLVAIYAILAISFFTWIRIRAAKDPIYGDREDLVGPLVLFYFVAAAYAALLVWLIVTLIMTIPMITKRRDLLVRFGFVAIPTTVCVVSVVIAIFTGTIGPFNRDTLSWVYESAMYNLFVWILLLGYAPSKTSEDEETTPIRREQELLAVRPAREYQASNVSGFEQHDDL